MIKIFPHLFSLILFFNNFCFAETAMIGEPLESHKARCLISDAEYYHFLKLDYQHFDQDAQDGWRLIADKECYLLSAELIIRYIAAHPTLETWQRGNLYFHAGQLYAFDDRAIAAVNVMRKAHYDTSPASPIHWNAYVDATIAFLNKNSYALKRNRETMNHAVNGEPDPNLPIVDNMIRYFYKSYAYVYTHRE